MSKSWAETMSGDKGALRKLNWLNQLKQKNFYEEEMRRINEILQKD